ncbi:MAG: hypothetical protein HQK60_16765 [Deltaproteobacteria bacterium]|nr:hypothetical protein [Deltaproteobacteria bacterium]
MRKFILILTLCLSLTYLDEAINAMVEIKVATPASSSNPGRLPELR